MALKVAPKRRREKKKLHKFKWRRQRWRRHRPKLDSSCVFIKISTGRRSSWRRSRREDRSRVCHVDDCCIPVKAWLWLVAIIYSSALSQLHETEFNAFSQALFTVCPPCYSPFSLPGHANNSISIFPWRKPQCK